MRYITTISLKNFEGKQGLGFGRGIAQLLSGVEKYGSLNHATKNMGMAYSKAWRIIKETEAEFGFPLLNRDGAHGSTLTPECKTMLEHYNEMLEAANTAAGKVFEKYYK